MINDATLQIENLSKSYPGKQQKSLKAVNSVSLRIAKGEAIGLVGESGCGKSTLARIICGLTEEDEGDVLFQGKFRSFKNHKDRKAYYRKVQMVFQDPMSIFSPRMRIGEYLAEPFINFGLMKQKEAQRFSKNLLKQVYLPEEMILRYASELSGGQLQRVVIARAIGLKPVLLVCDEATSSLDVTVQQEIVRLLMKLKNQQSMSMLFITHDLALAQQVCGRLYVMKSGAIVENIESCRLNEAQHPYTKSLMKAVFTL